MTDWEEQLANAMESDRFRLRRQYARIEQLPDNHPRKRLDWERWLHAVQSSVERRQSRQAISPTLQYDPELPITAHRDQLIQLIQDRQTIVVCGETGSGKSTQLPKLCLEAGRGRGAMIGHTQPRRLAARSIAKRLAEELDTDVGQWVGFKIRFTDRTMPNTLVKLMTDGVLLAEIQRDRMLDAYDTIIIDEAHERSLNIDLLMAYIHRLLQKRPELRLIITSATIDAERFSQHFPDAFGPAPVVTVSGRTYPVDVRYRGAGDSTDEWSDGFWMNRFTQAVDELSLSGFGDILAFLPTERHIRDATKYLRGHLTHQGLQDRLEILPLYSRLTEAEQQKIFEPHKSRRIVLATNVAESSLTVPGIRFVIDTGTARISRYAPRSKVQRLPIEPVSQASADQRAGRCGRLGPGICIRLYSEEDYAGRPRFTTPEIRRTNLASAILQSQMLGVGDLQDLPLLDPPRADMINDGLATLRELNAIDDHNRLTALGRRLGRWPVDPRVGRMILEADHQGCLADVLIIAAALEVQDARVRPAEKQAAADLAHQRFLDSHSDFVSLLKIWDFYHHLKNDLGRSRLQKACNENFLSLPRLREWVDVHRQLTTLVTEQGLRIGQRLLVPELSARVHPAPAIAAPRSQRPPRNRSRPPGDSGSSHTQHLQNKSVSLENDRGSHSGPVKRPMHYDRIHQSIMSGLLSGLGMLDDDRKYKGAGGIDYQLWPGSGLKALRPKWIFTAEIVETHARFGRTAAAIDPEWIEPLAKHLMKYSYDEPHFSEKAGSAMVHQRGTLFGIPVVQRRRVPLAPIDPVMARKLLIDEGLVQRKLRSRAAFYQHNNQLLDEVHEWANRTRRRELVVDPYFLIAFYEQRLPADVVDRSSLERFDREHPRPGKALPNKRETSESVWLDWDQVAETLDRHKVREAFPDRIQMGPTQMPLIYRFAPGDQLDGVSVVVPEVAVPQLHQEQLDWLVPGLLEDKVQALIKSLPKSLRRNLVPAPEVAAKATQWLLQAKDQGKAFWPAVCECLSRLAEETIRPGDFQLDKLSEHHRMLVSVVDESGQVTVNTRDLNELRGPAAASAAIATPSIEQLPQFTWWRDSMKSFDIDELPEQVIVPRGPVKVTLFPTIVADGDQFKTQLAESRALAEHALQDSLVQMYAAMESREIKSQINHLPGWAQAQMFLSGRIAASNLRQRIGQLIARLAFVEGQPPVRTQSAFEKRRSDRIARIALATQEVARWLPKLAESYHKVAMQLEAAPPQWSANVADIKQQLNDLLKEQAIYDVPWEWLKEFPRYVLAIAARLDRLKTIGSQKDLALLQSVEPFLQDLSKRSQAPHDERQANLLLEYRFAIEEFRVSIFAQQLGTRMPISTKRLEKIAAAIDGG